MSTHAEGRLDERRALKIRGEQALELVITLVTPPTSERAGSQGPLQRSDVAASTETPLYKRRWLWTSVGALVAGGVVAGVLLSMRDRRVADANGGSTGDTLFIK